MRGDDRPQQAMFSYLSPEQRVPQDHPLRAIRTVVDEVLRDMSPAFDAIYAKVGRPSIPPEQLLRTLLLQVLYTIRSERQLMEQLDYNLLYRWFVGLNMDAPVWDPTTFSKNRQRLLEGDIAQAFFDRVLAQARARDLLSAEHFTVDGTLLEAWASLKSFRPKDEGRAPAAPQPPDDPGNPTVDFHGERRSNATHASTTDPDARLYRKGKGREAKLCYMGHALMENRNGLVVDAKATLAAGTAEAEAAEDLVERLAGDPEVDTQSDDNRPRTVAADKGYDTPEFVGAMRDLNVTPHVAQKTKGSAIDGRTTRHSGYAVSQRKRKRVEEIFGWLKTVGPLRKLHHRGTDLVDWMFVFACAVYNLVRMRNLAAAA
jgi:transposase